VDLVGGTVTVRKTRVMVNGVVKRSLPKTRRGRRVLYIDPETATALRTWQAAQAKEHEAFAAQWQDEEDHGFTHVVRFSQPIRYGVRVRPDWVTRTFQKVAKQAGLPPLRLHGLRHSWATTAHLNGVGLRAIADQLGHADTRVTDRTYTATLQRVQEEAAALVAQSITTARGVGRRKVGQNRDRGRLSERYLRVETKATRG
jgi:integrase